MTIPRRLAVDCWNYYVHADLVKANRSFPPHRHSRCIAFPVHRAHLSRCIGWAFKRYH